jgi:LmbE family N-acetylglucosaminyl deacetylase
MKASKRAPRNQSRLKYLTALIALVASALMAQTPRQVSLKPSVDASPLPIDRGAAALWQTLAKLDTRASLLMLTAHPDDEDSGMLAFVSRGQGARVILLTLNRGEGGQNVMSSDYWDALGVLRTQELLAADRYYGAQQYFTRAVDFGFSKTKEESLAKWGHERLLYDVVRVVRMTRPLVITSVWVGGPSDGHGQHEVAGELAQEVFKAAGDPHVFPDQIRAGLRPWKPLRMYARVPFFSISNGKMYDYATRQWSPAGVYDYIHDRWMPGIPDTDVTIPEGEYNPLLGLSYFQIGAEGLGEQKSQNGGVGFVPAGSRSGRYHCFATLVPGGVKGTSFFQGIDASLLGIARLASGDANDEFLKAGLAGISRLVEQARHQFRATNPEGIAPTLAKGLKATNELMARVQASSLPDEAKYNIDFELGVKQDQFNSAILQSLGISMQTVVTPFPASKRNPFESGFAPTFSVAVPGQTFHVEVRIVNPSYVAVDLNRISLSNPSGENWTIQPLSQPTGTIADGKVTIALFKVTVPSRAAFTRPYFWRPNIEQPYYDILDKRYLNLPFAPYPLTASADLTYEEAQIRFAKVVQTVERIRGEGTVLEPLVVGPALSVWTTPRAGIIPLDTQTASLSVTIRNNTEGPTKGVVHLNLPTGWTSSPPMADFSLARNGQSQALNFRIHAAHLQHKSYTVTAVAEDDGREYQSGFERIGYAGLEPYNFYQPATYRVTGVNLKIPSGLRVGYVEGTGDEVPQALESLGIRVHSLSTQDLATRNLASYDAIVLGVRAYAARQDVKAYNARLLDYVKNGGVLIVQYNTPEFDHDYGPYPYSLTQNPQVVVDEDSRMVILKPENPAFEWPNRITARDFDDWVEERGHGFMTSWDPRYEALVETHDPHQPPQKGGLLYARYGKGVYIYDALAFYRQLPEGVPGAYRIFANLVSLAKNPELHASPKRTLRGIATYYVPVPSSRRRMR